MKPFVTKKAVNESFVDRVFQVPYCSLWHVLRTSTPFGYHAGVYGWNCDFYELYMSNGWGVCISTGYRPNGRKVPADILKKYEKEATEALTYSDYEKRLVAIRTRLADELASL